MHWLGGGGPGSKLNEVPEALANAEARPDLPLTQRFNRAQTHPPAGPPIDPQDYSYVVVLASGEVVKTQWHRLGGPRPELTSLVGVLGGPNYASSNPNPEDFLGQEATRPPVPCPSPDPQPRCGHVGGGQGGSRPRSRPEHPGRGLWARPDAAGLLPPAYRPARRWRGPPAEGEPPPVSNGPRGPPGVDVGPAQHHGDRHRPC